LATFLFFFLYFIHNFPTFPFVVTFILRLVSVCVTVRGVHWVRVSVRLRG